MFEPNEKVVCVDDKIHPEIAYLYKNLPKKGQVYTVRDCTMGSTNNFSADPYANISFKVTLEELINDIDPTTVNGCMEELGFRSDRFVPVEEVSEEEEASVLIGVGAESDKPHWL
jgi:hypothetical protein